MLAQCGTGKINTLDFGGNSLVMSATQGKASEINQTTKNGFGQTFDTESDTVGGGVKVLATNGQGSSVVAVSCHCCINMCSTHIAKKLYFQL